MNTQSPTLHEDLHRALEAKRSSDRSFGIVFTVVFGVIALLPLIGGGGIRLWALAVAGVLLGLSVGRPAVLAPLNRLWTGLGLWLHRVISPIMLAFLFYVVVTPTGVLMRLFGKDPLRLSRGAAADSYWIERRPPGPAPDSIRNQF